MTLSDLMQSDVTDVFMNTDDFAETILRYVNGDPDNTCQVTAIVSWYPTVPEMSGGRATKRRGEMLISSDDAVTKKDSFKIGDDRAEVEAVGPKQDGAQIVYLVQEIRETRGAVPVRTGGL